MPMATSGRLNIFAIVQPGLEPLLLDEVRELGWTAAKAQPGGISFEGGWPDVWRANLLLRGAGRVLVRIGAFRAEHLAQLDKRSRQLPWAEFIPEGRRVRVEATCRKSRIYHSGAAAERIEKSLRLATAAVRGDVDDLRVFVRIDQNICTVSIDTSGELLHKRGYKHDVGKAPLRETQAALFLRACGYNGAEPVLDPMCGSGTIVLEAAEIAKGLAPGRGRSFAFENLRGFDLSVWGQMKKEIASAEIGSEQMFRGFDCDEGVVAASTANAERAGLASITSFSKQNISNLERPEGPAGLVLVNPPYGARIGEGHALSSLYQTLGRRLKEAFSGWRAGIITSEERLAKATGLPFSEIGPPVPHGPLRIRLYRTAVL
ncbi:class I SAM-dependent RNA methyltransferase [Parvularcula marina]|uniref:THUMP domain-containing class I SAM-dependent RNA methyltransferase n=1 Tax=Parvularcula marina TaxID=2292771 RepID=UPI003517660B